MQSLIDLNYSDSNVTSLSHILTIHNFSKEYKGGLALEIGSYQGHATLAMALAGLNIVSYDIDTTQKQYREKLLEDFNVEWLNINSKHSLNESRFFDIIFHDAEHGNKIVPELEALWIKINNGGLFIIHDTEQITIPLSFINPIYHTRDIIGRELSIYKKTIQQSLT